MVNATRRAVEAAARTAGIDATGLTPLRVGENVILLLPEVEATDLVTLAGFLRQLHSIPVPQDPPLGPVRPFVRLAERIESAPTLAVDDRRFLHDMQVDLLTQWGWARFELAPSDAASPRACSARPRPRWGSTNRRSRLAILIKSKMRDLGASAK